MLKRKIAITRMLMDVQEHHQSSQNVSSASALLDPISNCYMAEQGRLGGAETLNATFARFTKMYGHWQKDRATLILKHVLGEGNFGSVVLGIMPDIQQQGLTSQVAVKTIKASKLSAQAVAEFEKEVEIMTSLHHDSIVSLLGLCTETLPLYIIMEFMENGQLNTFLVSYFL